MVKNIGGQEDSLSWLFFFYIRDCRGVSIMRVSQRKKMRAIMKWWGLWWLFSSWFCCRVVVLSDVMLCFTYGWDRLTNRASRACFFLCLKDGIVPNLSLSLSLSLCILPKKYFSWKNFLVIYPIISAKPNTRVKGRDGKQ